MNVKEIKENYPQIDVERLWNSYSIYYDITKKLKYLPASITNVEVELMWICDNENISENELVKRIKVINSKNYLDELQNGYIGSDAHTIKIVFTDGFVLKASNSDYGGILICRPHS